jgi:hypothetical protein
MPIRRDIFTRDYEAGQRRDLARMLVNMFLCGPGTVVAKRGAKRKVRDDIRSFQKKKIYAEFAQCQVKLGEHVGLIRAFRRAAGKTAANLADHELGLASTKGIDLVVIFPCADSPRLGLSPRLAAAFMTRRGRCLLSRREVHGRSPLVPLALCARTISSLKDLIVSSVIPFAASFLTGSKDSSRAQISFLAASSYPNSCEK